MAFKFRLLDLAYVPGVRFNRFSLHAAMHTCPVTLDVWGAHILDGHMTLMRRDAGSQSEATRIVETPIAAAGLIV